MAVSTIKKTAVPVLKRTVNGNTFTFTFPAYGAEIYAIVFGRFGYDSNKMSFSIISHVGPDLVAVQNYGTQNITATCTGNTVTVTTPYTQANVWVYCPFGAIT